MLICEKSFRFSRTIYGILLLIAYLINNIWLVLVVGILMGMGAVSMNYNLFYQLRLRFLGKNFTSKPLMVTKDINEVRFACVIASIFLVLAFLLFYFWNLRSLAWILTGLVIILSLLAGLTGVCVGSIMYVFFKKIFKKS